MNVVERLVSELGGIRPACVKIEQATGRKVFPGSVQHWLKRGHFPASRHQDILTTARAEKVPLELSELVNAT